MTMTEHTDKQYEADLALLRERLLLMGGKAEEMIGQAMRALTERDSARAQQVVEADREIDRLEMDIDDLCLRILALWQPAASDLRFVTLALKIVTDLERIGDECKNIGERAIELNQVPQLKPFIDLPRMAQIVQEMVRGSLDAFVQADAERALAVAAKDDEVDGLCEQIFRELVSYMVEDVHTISRATKLLAVTKYLERIADHATNISEMVVFLVQARDIRHPASRGGAARA